MKKDVYRAMKGNIYPLALLCAGKGNKEAQEAGFRDVFDLIMSDSDHSRQATFLMQLQTSLPSEKQRLVLLDGMAREYAGCKDWLDYVDSECS